MFYKTKRSGHRVLRPLLLFICACEGLFADAGINHRIVDGVGGVFGHVELHDEGDGVGVVIVGEVDVGRVAVLVHADQVASVGGTVVAVLVVDALHLLHLVVAVHAPDFDILREGEVSVGAVEVQVGFKSGAVERIDATQVHAKHVGEEVGHADAASPVGVVQVGGCLHAGAGGLSSVVVGGDGFFLFASRHGEGESCNGNDKNFFHFNDWIECFQNLFTPIRT